MLAKKDLKNLANLAKLELRPEEINLYEKQLEEVLGYVAKINKLDLEKTEASLSGVEERNLVALRSDEVGVSDSSLIKQALHNKDNYVETPQVFER
jgi:aspartyl-tRNA(Asn)/glutamyl-tRNA(Gln) amidotransferase subunit C